jgi:DNA-directed RNA polymerase subunit beta'
MPQQLTNIGALLISEALPEELRQEQYDLSKKGVHKLFMQLAEKHPDKYKEVLQQLSTIGATAAWTEGASVSLSSLRRSPAKEAMLAPIRQKITAAIDDDTLTDDEREKLIVETLIPEVDKLNKAVYEESKGEDSPFVLQLDSGARGKKSDINSLRGAELLATDAQDRFMPIPLWRSYAEGMTPAQYFAASYGQRKGDVGVKFATADAGFMAKRLSNAAHRFVVTRETPAATRVPVGLPTMVDDKDNVGAVLAYDAGPVKAGTVLTSDLLDDIKDAGVDEILLHSTMTELSEDGGVSRLAAGRRLGNQPPPIGENIGLQSAQTIGERLSQGALGSKHRSTNTAQADRSGIEYLNRLLDAPEHFPEAGPLADEDGVVGDVVKAPQGGSYMSVGTKQYYVPEGVNPIVKPGDHVEAGDDLTDGAPHPRQLVRLRGLGEARRVYLQHFREALAASGAETHRRNLEPVVAGLLNWAKVTNPDGIGDNVYDDVVPFNRLASQYKPRASAVEQDPAQAVGSYLEEPALHYTPGTRITKKVAKHLKKWKIPTVFTHKDAPDFEPEMMRSMYSVYHDPDWRTRLLGFYTSAAFEDAVHRGGESDIRSTSYAPALAKPNVLGRHLSSLGKYGRAG